VGFCGLCVGYPDRFEGFLIFFACGLIGWNRHDCCASKLIREIEFRCQCFPARGGCYVQRKVIWLPLPKESRTRWRQPAGVFFAPQQTPGGSWGESLHYCHYFGDFIYCCGYLEMV
jgi:hypothetical protein